MNFHDFHEANHSYHCDGLLTSVHGLTLFRDLAAFLQFFLSAATYHVFAMRKAVTADTASKNSPQTTRPCAATHCKIIELFRFHDFTALD